jgi:hypothetical protein
MPCLSAWWRLDSNPPKVPSRPPGPRRTQPPRGPSKLRSANDLATQGTAADCSAIRNGAFGRCAMIKHADLPISSPSVGTGRHGRSVPPIEFHQTVGPMVRKMETYHESYHHRSGARHSDVGALVCSAALEPEHQPVPGDSQLRRQRVLSKK